MNDHRCLSGPSCVAAEILIEGNKKSRQPAQTEKPDSLCPSCVRKILRAVEDLPADYVALHVSLGEQTSAGGARVKSTPSPPLPVDVHKYALMEAIVTNLDTAADIVSDALRCDPPSGPVAPRVASTALMVSVHLPKLLEAPEVAVWAWESCDRQRCGRNGCQQGEHLRLTDKSGVQFARTLLDLHRRARAAVGETEKLIRLPMPCGQCGEPFCYQKPDSNTVFCRSCGSDWTEDLYAFAGQLSKQQQKENQEMAELDELRQRAELAEYLLAERDWLLSLAAECTDVSAAAFFATVMERKAS